MLEPDFLAVLACPKCDERPPLVDHDAELECTKCHWRFPVVNGIPHLLVEEALPPRGENS